MTKILKSEQKRSQILNAASALFSEHGYKINMEQIAKVANVSKQTVYSHFKNKDELFETCMQARCAEREISPSAFDMSASLSEELVKFGVKFQNLLLDEQSKQTFQNAVSQANTHPEIAAVFLETGPKKTITLLADYLQSKIDSGDLVLSTSSSTINAARQLLLMFHGKSAYWAFFGHDSDETDEERLLYTKECVAMFLNANQTR
ncbi:TetR/AcrR family transcriptional regulator [uncultured Vibrio sp.]|uniref:TetR/AcrR family transcriptional regulator n=1 Tax=uncultured Vibrio sp. TaxID=114054 RepID=UPI0025ED603F|nr:TetR/AcrR family transcriptional regulator [uncultured Vibrio sp.]